MGRLICPGQGSRKQKNLAVEKLFFGNEQQQICRTRCIFQDLSMSQDQSSLCAFSVMRSTVTRPEPKVCHAWPWMIWRSWTRTRRRSANWVGNKNLFLIKDPFKLILKYYFRSFSKHLWCFPCFGLSHQTDPESSR